MNPDDHAPIQSVKQIRRIVITGVLMVLIPFCACIGYVETRYIGQIDPPDGITARTLGPISVQGERIVDPICDTHRCWATYRVAFVFSDPNGTHTVPLVSFPVRSRFNRSFGRQEQSLII
jgi:hypothetical protein